MQLSNFQTIPTLEQIPQFVFSPRQFRLEILENFQFSFPKNLKTVSEPGNSEEFPKLATTISRRRGTYGDTIQKNPMNNSFYRSCPPRTRVQQGKLDYHLRVVKKIQILLFGIPTIKSALCAI